MSVSRRDFARSVGAGVLLSKWAHAKPFRADPETGGKRLRYCIVGLGRISLNHFMPASKLSQKSEVTALVSGHRDKAEKTAAEYNIPAKNIYRYENYDEIRDNKDIDAVYIALPNNMHAEYTIRAANAGKHVLSEKPMATSVKDAEAMIAACRAANVKLFIAYRCQYEPTNLKAIELIKSGAIGKVQSIVSTNGFNIKAGEWRLDKKMSGGGPLLDMGVYSLNACRYLTGEEPVHLEGYTSVADDDGRFQTVEENDSWTMKFPSGIVAACSTTYGANMPGAYHVFGSKGFLVTEPAFAYQGIRMTVHLQDQEPYEVAEADKDPMQFAVEADEFASCIAENREPKTDGQEGLRDMKYMDAIYKSAGLKLS